jgi:hypothetical protein
MIYKQMNDPNITQVETVDTNPTAPASPDSGSDNLKSAKDKNTTILGLNSEKDSPNLNLNTINSPQQGQRF